MYSVDLVQAAWPSWPRAANSVPVWSAGPPAPAAGRVVRLPGPDDFAFSQAAAAV